MNDVYPVGRKACEKCTTWHIPTARRSGKGFPVVIYLTGEPPGILNLNISIDTIHNISLVGWKHVRGTRLDIYQPPANQQLRVTGSPRVIYLAGKFVSITLPMVSHSWLRLCLAKQQMHRTCATV